MIVLKSLMMKSKESPEDLVLDPIKDLALLQAPSLSLNPSLPQPKTKTLISVIRKKRSSLVRMSLWSSLKEIARSLEEKEVLKGWSLENLPQDIIPNKDLLIDTRDMTETDMRNMIVMINITTEMIIEEDPEIEIAVTEKAETEKIPETERNQAEIEAKKTEEKIIEKEGTIIGTREKITRKEEMKAVKASPRKLQEEKES